MVVIDSSQVTGAQIILKFILRKKEKKLEMKRKMTLARRKTLIMKRQSDMSNLSDLALAKKLTKRMTNQRRSEVPHMPLPALTYKSYGTDKICKEIGPTQPEIAIKEQASPDTGKVKFSPQKTVQIAENFIKPEETKLIEADETVVKVE